MWYVLFFVGAYLIGNINPAIIVARKTKNIDIRSINSKNAGTSNAVMTIGWRWGMFVLFMDMLKGFVPALIARLIFPDNDVYWYVAGFGAIIGHIYPVFLGFHGGKGTATFGGVLFATVPVVAAILFVSTALILLISDYIAVATLIVTVATPIILYFLGVETASLIIMIVFVILSFYKHRENYLRLVRGQEVGLRKFYRNKDKIRVK